MKRILVSNNETAKNIGLFFIRVSLGVIFIRHGWPKILNGPSEWAWLGSQMAHIGITFAPTMWGFFAAMTEFFGGICLVVGFATRFFSFLLSFVMFVAALMHYNQGDQWGVMSHPLALAVVFFGLMIAGGGSFSVDGLFACDSDQGNSFNNYPDNNYPE